MPRKCLLVAFVVAALLLVPGAAALAHRRPAAPPAPRISRPVVKGGSVSAGTTVTVGGEIKPRLSADTSLTAVVVLLKWDGSAYTQVSQTSAKLISRRRARVTLYKAKLGPLEYGFYRLQSVLVNGEGSSVATSCSYARLAVWPTDSGVTPARVRR